MKYERGWIRDAFLIKAYRAVRASTVSRIRGCFLVLLWSLAFFDVDRAGLGGRTGRGRGLGFDLSVVRFERFWEERAWIDGFCCS